MDDDSISEGIICEKALRTYADLLMEIPSTGADGESWFTFKASRSWFEKPKHRSGIHIVVRHGEAAKSKKEATEKYVGEFHDFVDAGYLPSKCNETGLS